MYGEEEAQGREIFPQSGAICKRFLGDKRVGGLWAGGEKEVGFLGEGLEMGEGESGSEWEQTGVTGLQTH